MYSCHYRHLPAFHFSISYVMKQKNKLLQSLILPQKHQDYKIFPKENKRLDSVFLFFILILCLFGTIMVMSAGSAYAEFRYGDSWYFLRRQALFLVIGLLLMYVTSRIHTTIWYDMAFPLYCLTIFLLLLVLIIGLVGNGAKRWISIGPITIQPSEIGKLTMALFLSKYYTIYENKAILSTKKRDTFFYGTLFPLIIVGIIVLLVMLQKHLSCIIILGLIGISLMFISGMRVRYLSLFLSSGILGVGAFAFLTDYTKERITVWQNPELYKLTGGWQTLQGLMAIGSGGLTGLGLGKGLLKYCYISEPANDMIFTVLCEETGFLGATVVMVLFGCFLFRGFTIALNASNTFEKLLAFGICSKIAIQVLLNVSVVTNTIPNTGISLPFFSYGGSSLIMLLFEMGIMLSISRNSVLVK